MSVFHPDPTGPACLSQDGRRAASRCWDGRSPGQCGDRPRWAHRYQGLPSCLPCRAAAVVPDPDLRVRDHPPLPGVDRVALAELNSGQQALLVLAYLPRERGKTFRPDWRPGSGFAQATAWRYVNETTSTLSLLGRWPNTQRARLHLRYSALTGACGAIGAVSWCFVLDRSGGGCTLWVRGNPGARQGPAERPPFLV